MRIGEDYGGLLGGKGRRQVKTMPGALLQQWQNGSLCLGISCHLPHYSSATPQFSCQLRCPPPSPHLKCTQVLLQQHYHEDFRPDIPPDKALPVGSWHVTTGPYKSLMVECWAQEEGERWDGAEGWGHGMVQRGGDTQWGDGGVGR